MTREIIMSHPYMYKNDLEVKIASLKEKISKLEAEAKILKGKKAYKEKELAKLVEQLGKGEYFVEDRNLKRFGCPSLSI